jgi:hypothetical protein
MNAFSLIARIGPGLIVSLTIAMAGSGVALVLSPSSADAGLLRATVQKRSLLAVTAAQVTQARVRVPNARLFEVHTAIRPQDITSGVPQMPFVASDFAAPDNDVTYLTVSTWFTSQGQRTEIADKVGYVSAGCTGGAARPNCGSATGQSEPRLRHLPLAGWKIDMGQLLRILKTNSYVSAGYSQVTVTTAGRAAATMSGPVARLAALVPAQAVILVREATAPRYHFIFVNATTGAVIDKGVAVAPPPRS